MKDDKKIALSVLVPVTEKERFEEIIPLYKAYKRAVERSGLCYEFIYILDGDFPAEEKALNELKNQGEAIKVLKLGKWFGESTALSVGFDHSLGDLVLTLPAYEQIDATEIPRILNGMEQNDMIIIRRWPRRDNWINRVQSAILNKIVAWMTGMDFHDLGSSIRLIHRRVFEDVRIYGDQHRFLPVLVRNYGYRVKEINIPQSQKDAFGRKPSPGIFIRRMLDLFSIFFLIKFTKKPLRFFGLVGIFLFVIGMLFTFYLFVQRLFFNIGLADRPIVLVALLLIILGIQILAIGLIGEIVIFTHAKDLKEYKVEEIFKK